jgi:hypothetical protein
LKLKEFENSSESGGSNTNEPQNTRVGLEEGATESLKCAGFANHKNLEGDDSRTLDRASHKNLEGDDSRILDRAELNELVTCENLKFVQRNNAKDLDGGINHGGTNHNSSKSEISQRASADELDGAGTYKISKFLELNIVDGCEIATEIVVPGLLDIVSGRGRQSKESVGYLRLRNLIEKHYDAYQVRQ